MKKYLVFYNNSNETLFTPIKLTRSLKKANRIVKKLNKRFAKEEDLQDLYCDTMDIDKAVLKKKYNEIFYKKID